MASFIKAFVVENATELRRMNARQFVQQIVALGAPLRLLLRSCAHAGATRACARTGALLQDAVER